MPVELRQTGVLPEMVGTGLGFTVMVNVIGVPGQPLDDGVTVIVATFGVAPGLVAVNDGISPVPLAASPIVGSLLVQENVVPASGLLNGIGAVVAPSQ